MDGAPTDPVRLGIELDRGAEPITGRLRFTDGVTLPFVGWLELTQALQEAQRQDDRAEGDAE